MPHRYNIHEISSLIRQLESDAQFIKYTNPSESYKMSIAANVIKQLMFEPFSPVSEEPPFKVGDKDYTGYLVVVKYGRSTCYEVADYTKGNKHNVNSLNFEFHVDGEYEPNVTHWMCLPKKPEAESQKPEAESQKFDAHKTSVGMRLDAGLFD